MVCSLKTVNYVHWNLGGSSTFYSMLHKNIHFLAVTVTPSALNVPVVNIVVPRYKWLINALDREVTA